MIQPQSSLLLSSLLFLSSAISISLDVSPSGGNASSPLLYGLMFEDINYSGDGGIHSQLLRNNGFQGGSPDLTAYDSVGDVSLSVDTKTPLTEAINVTLRVTVAENATGEVGFSNEGYWGIPVNDDTYRNGFYIKGDYQGPISLKLVGASDGIVYASDTINVTSTVSGFTSFSTTYKSKQAPNSNNTWTLTFDGLLAANSSLNFALPVLYGTAWLDRPNGLKPAHAESLQNITASFLRFPGGANILGSTLGDRWIWNATIGPLEDRPGRFGGWGYANTDALGYLEYLIWCEDMNLSPLLAIWAGLSLDETVLTGDALQPYVESALNELEYARGSVDTPYGKLRAEHGHTEPFNVQHVEIGNEDYLMSFAQASYAERFSAFYDAIHAAYPDIVVVASGNIYNPSPFPKGAWVDWHNYQNSTMLISQFDMFDNLDRSIPYVIGEYACIWTDDNYARLPYPMMQGSVAEAVFLIGVERNSDLVQMASYAPLMQNIGSTQWAPDMISFDQDPNGLILSTSYYVNQMFSTNRGATILSVSSDSPFGPVYWVASKTAGSSLTYFVKLANTDNATQNLTIHIPGTSHGRLTTLAGYNLTASNTPEAKYSVFPVEEDIKAEGAVFDVTMPAWSVAVLAAE